MYQEHIWLYFLAYYCSSKINSNEIKTVINRQSPIHKILLAMVFVIPKIKQPVEY